MGVHCWLNDFSFEERENLYDSVHFYFSFLMSSQQGIPVHSGLCWKRGLYSVCVSVCIHCIACIDNAQQCLYCVKGKKYRFMANKGHKTPETWCRVRCYSNGFAHVCVFYVLCLLSICLEKNCAFGSLLSTSGTTFLCMWPEWGPHGSWLFEESVGGKEAISNAMLSLPE